MRRNYLFIFFLLVLAVFVSCSQDVHTHTWDSGVVTSPATCLSIGVKTYTCTGCGETKYEILEMIDHTPGETITKNATCTEHGSIETKCTMCGQILSHEDIEPFGHNWNVVETITDPTCETAGISRCVCLNCQAEENVTIEALGHDFSDTIERIDPTCTSKGSEYSRCTRCDLARRAEIPMLEHTYDEGTVLVNPTCQAVGTLRHTCTSCGHTEDVDIETVDHNHVFDHTENVATCISTGLDVYYCSVCGHEHKEVTAIDSSSHAHTSWIKTKDPGTVFPGEEREKCSDCNQYTGNTREVERYSIVGYWRCQEETIDFNGSEATEWFELNIDENNVISAWLMLRSDSIGGTMANKLFEESFTVSDTNPDPDSYVGAIEINDEGIFGVIEDGENGFTLCLPGAGEGCINRNFTKVSENLHVHTYSSQGIPYNTTQHLRVTTCTDHEAYYVAEFHSDWVEDSCGICGADRCYVVTFYENNDTHSSAYATKAEGCIVPVPVYGNAWELPGQGIYYMPGDTYYPTGNFDFLQSCTL